MCKVHFFNQIRNILSKEFRNLYRSSETAYGSLDFKGKGYVSPEDIMESMAVKRHLNKNFNVEDLNNFYTYYNLFPLKGGHR